MHWYETSITRSSFLSAYFKIDIDVTNTGTMIISSMGHLRYFIHTEQGWDNRHKSHLCSSFTDCEDSLQNNLQPWVTTLHTGQLQSVSSSCVFTLFAVTWLYTCTSTLTFGSIVHNLCMNIIVVHGSNNIIIMGLMYSDDLRLVC